MKTLTQHINETLNCLQSKHIESNCLQSKHINESNILDDIIDGVHDYFYSHTREEDYDSYRDKINDLKVMADGANDSMIDACIYYLNDEYDISENDTDKYYDNIVNELIELAKEQI